MWLQTKQQMQNFTTIKNMHIKLCILKASADCHSKTSAANPPSLLYPNRFKGFDRLKNKKWYLLRYAAQKEHYRKYKILSEGEPGDRKVPTWSLHFMLNIYHFNILVLNKEHRNSDLQHLRCVFVWKLQHLQCSDVQREPFLSFIPDIWLFWCHAPTFPAALSVHYNKRVENISR